MMKVMYILLFLSCKRDKSFIEEKEEEKEHKISESIPSQETSDKI